MYYPQSANATDRETGLALLGMLAGSHASFFSTPSNVQSIANIFSLCLLDISNDGRVMLAAIRAFCSLLTALPQESDFDHFQCVISPMMGGLALALQAPHARRAPGYPLLDLRQAPTSLTEVLGRV